MSVSRRVSMAWGEGPPYEDTDTIVLTGHTYFVDVRVKKNSVPDELDWASAGIKTSKDLGDGSAHCTWKHFVDSRSRNPDVDEGIVVIRPEDPLRCVERGRMKNPDTGCVEEYEEIWLDESIRKGTRVAILERDDGDAFVAIIGPWKLGVGWDWAWRTDGGDSLEGSEIKVEGNVRVGDKIGKWVIREFWST
ncbi:hypothetical protein SERLA73DRAFT_159630 [Serpula lacrymans var. lacrymans S7.3]|uniref:Protein HRI1 n=1 Tax=Serpula lacrymans var. lacrymans (strain S7.3) TaxID=936435 RepID=F8PTV3_SERL3|nr:hypothetical protein SERLA73DRAFT_159630 [Serpula lacrymans var. lacrymans S7.3]